MTCQAVAPKLSAFLDGELPSADETLVRHHLEICEPCAAECESLASAWERLGELPRVEPHAHLWPGIEARLTPETARRGWRRWRRFPAMAALALVAGLLLGLQVGAVVVSRPASPTRAANESDGDSLHVQYFGDVFPGSLPDAVLNVDVETRTSQPGGERR